MRGNFPEVRGISLLMAVSIVGFSITSFSGDRPSLSVMLTRDTRQIGAGNYPPVGTEISNKNLTESYPSPLYPKVKI